MRSKALYFLLSLSLMFCVGFGSSLTASAATTKQIDFVCEIHNYENNPPDIEYGSGAVLLTTNTSSKPELIFDVLIPYRTLQGVDENGYYVFNFVPHSQAAGNLSLTVEYYDTSNVLKGTGYANRTSSDLVNNSYFVYMNSQATLGVGNSYNIARSRIRIVWPEGASRFETCMFSISVVYVDSEGNVNDVVAAIQQQTSDIQQSIQDQYGGDPGNSFPVDDIITQHNEKMGVLSFSSDALMQVLGLLSPDQTLSSELVFPSMSLTIAGQRNRVQLWPEYRFDLNTLKQHWPNFVGLMQSLTTALVWIFVLRYCYRVFEKYFLAGGGS